jgi:NADH-quinone oxidoreductase subunit L
MEGPTPVSALIHAATMVTAGVYLVARMHPIYDTASTAHHAVAIIGALTSLFAASIAFVQTDIKRVLAYSTMSQIGYMFLAVGVGAYSAALFHLVAHAFFKALLFMAAGNVIHASHDEQDMRKFSGLWDHMKGTSWCFLIGSLSLVGTIPLVGFFSKDLILDQALSKPGDPIATLVWGIGLATALMTGFYTGRMWYLSFWKRPGMPATEHKPHEAPWVMLGPVIVLTVLTVIGGWVLQGTALNESLSNVLTAYLEPVVGKLPWGPLPYGWVIALGTTAAGTGLFGFAYLFYGRESLDATKVRHRLSWLHTLLEKKYYFDEFYDLIFVRGMDAFAKLLRTGVETPLIDGTVSGTARTLEGAAGQLSLVQNGYFRSYALAFLGGVVVVAVIVVVSIH